MCESTWLIAENRASAIREKNEKKRKDELSNENLQLRKSISIGRRSRECSLQLQLWKVHGVKKRCNFKRGPCVPRNCANWLITQARVSSLQLLR